MTKDSTLLLTIQYCSLGEAEANEFGLKDLREPYFRFIYLDKVHSTSVAKTRHEGLPIFNETFELKALKHAVTEKKEIQIEAHEQDETSTYLLGRTAHLAFYELFTNMGLEMGTQHKRDLDLFDN